MFCLLPLISLFLCTVTAERHGEHVFTQDEIIDLPVGRFPDPECAYTVREREREGKVLTRQIRVGDPVYHRWACSYDGQAHSNLYCLMVHNCTVSSTSGSKFKVPILDEFGCSLFPNVLPHVEYAGDLEGGLPVNAFSLDIDQPAVFFECSIKLLLKLQGVCRRPVCQPIEHFDGRGRRKHFRHRLF